MSSVVEFVRFALFATTFDSFPFDLKKIRVSWPILVHEYG